LAAGLGSAGLSAAGAVFYIISNPDEASRWFGEIQRVDPAVVRRVSDENPLYSAKSAEEVSLEIVPSSAITSRKGWLPHMSTGSYEAKYRWKHASLTGI
jgi:hypothetical protein